MFAKKRVGHTFVTYLVSRQLMRTNFQTRSCLARDKRKRHLTRHAKKWQDTEDGVGGSDIIFWILSSLVLGRSQLPGKGREMSTALGRNITISSQWESMSNSRETSLKTRDLLEPFRNPLTRAEWVDKANPGLAGSRAHGPELHPPGLGKNWEHVGKAGRMRV